MAQQHQVAVDRRFTYGYLPTGRTVNYGGYGIRQYLPFGFGQVDPTNVTQQPARSTGCVTQADRAGRAGICTDSAQYGGDPQIVNQR